MFIPEQQGPNSVTVVERNLGVRASMAPRLDFPFCEHHRSIIRSSGSEGKSLSKGAKRCQRALFWWGEAPELPKICPKVHGWPPGSGVPGQCAAEPRGVGRISCVADHRPRLGDVLAL